MSIEFSHYYISFPKKLNFMKINVDYNSLNDDLSKILSNIDGQYILYENIPTKEKLKFMIKNNAQSEISSSCTIQNYEIELSIYCKDNKIIIKLRYKDLYYRQYFELYQIYPYKSEILKNTNYSLIDNNQIDNHAINKNNNLNNSIHSENPKQIIDKLLNSKIGLVNFSGSCAIASIIQILAHSKFFLNSFYKNSQHSQSKEISNALMNLFHSMSSSKEKYLQDEFITFFVKIKQYFNLNKIEPTYFLNLLIKQLDKENHGIISPNFAGKSIINCYNNTINSPTQLTDSFLIYMLNICNNQSIEDYIAKGQVLTNEYSNAYQIEQINKTSDIVIINVRCNINNISFPQKINIKEKSYTLYGINEYNDIHSTA